MSTPSQVKRRWNNENYDRIFLSVKKGDKDKIKAKADSLGVSLNMYIQIAIWEKMEKGKINE